MNHSKIPTGDEVLSALGDEFVAAFINAVAGARDDVAEFKQWRPNWAGQFTSRFMANFIHERIWARLVQATSGLGNVSIVDREPLREIVSGGTFHMRIKRHHLDERIATYPTVGALEFWTFPEPMLEGLETWNLALGYYWDPELRAVGEPVISLRRDVTKPIWALTLQVDPSVATGFTWTAVEPELPEIDLSGIIEKEGEATGA